MFGICFEICFYVLFMKNMFYYLLITFLLIVYFSCVAVQDMYRQGIDHVLLELCFTKEFPYSPPTLRVVSPALSDPTHELLKWDGVVKTDVLASCWSRDKSVELLLVQIEVLICKLGVERLKKSWWCRAVWKHVATRTHYALIYTRNITRNICQKSFLRKYCKHLRRLRWNYSWWWYVNANKANTIKC